MKPENMFWCKKDGKHILVSSMETNHIENCIKMMKRNGYISYAEFMYYLPDSYKNKSEEELSKLGFMLGVNAWIDILKIELNKRNESSVYTEEDFFNEEMNLYY